MHILKVRMLQFAPVICEQSPSAPSSPTSPGSSRLRRPRPLNADAMEQISVVRLLISSLFEIEKKTEK